MVVRDCRPTDRAALARGLLAGGERWTTWTESDPLQDNLYERNGDLDVIGRIAELAAERGVAPAQIALTRLLHKPGVTAPIVGATKIEHVDQALAVGQRSHPPSSPGWRVGGPGRTREGSSPPPACQPRRKIS
jgi:aryl-alcohol dehydrogenase-like predicted oxidoreductase